MWYQTPVVKLVTPFNFSDCLPIPITNWTFSFASAAPSPSRRRVVFDDSDPHKEEILADEPPVTALKLSTFIQPCKVRADPLRFMVPQFTYVLEPL